MKIGVDMPLEKICRSARFVHSCILDTTDSVAACFIYLAAASGCCCWGGCRPSARCARSSSRRVRTVWGPTCMKCAVQPLYSACGPSAATVFAAHCQASRYSNPTPSTTAAGTHVTAQHSRHPLAMTAGMPAERCKHRPCSMPALRLHLPWQLPTWLVPQASGDDVHWLHHCGHCQPRRHGRQQQHCDRVGLPPAAAATLLPPPLPPLLPQLLQPCLDAIEHRQLDGRGHGYLEHVQSGAAVQSRHTCRYGMGMEGGWGWAGQQVADGVAWHQCCIHVGLCHKPAHLLPAGCWTARGAGLSRAAAPPLLLLPLLPPPPHRCQARRRPPSPHPWPPPACAS